jgi:hypothetical protein
MEGRLKRVAKGLLPSARFGEREGRMGVRRFDAHHFSLETLAPIAQR